MTVLIMDNRDAPTYLLYRDITHMLKDADGFSLHNGEEEMVWCAAEDIIEVRE